MPRLPYYIEVQFPNLRPGNYDAVSPPDRTYNCIAWAADIENLRFWPGVQGYRWPTNIPQEETIDAFVRFYTISGYEVCNSPELEQDYEKIAIYCDDEGIPTHAAKQLASGQWTSKLGESYDIIHDELCGIENGVGYGRYGRATVFMRRHHATA